MSMENITVNLNARNRAGGAIGQARQQVRSLTMEANRAGQAISRSARPIGGAMGGAMGRVGALGGVIAGGPMGLAVMGVAASIAGVVSMVKANAEREERMQKMREAWMEDERRERRAVAQAMRSTSAGAAPLARSIDDARIAGSPIGAGQFQAFGLDAAQGLPAATAAHRGGASVTQIMAGLYAAQQLGIPVDEAIKIAARLRSRANVENIALEYYGMRPTAAARRQIQGEIERSRAMDGMSPMQDAARGVVSLDRARIRDTQEVALAMLETGAIFPAMAQGAGMTTDELNQMNAIADAHREIIDRSQALIQKRLEAQRSVSAGDR